MRKLVRKITKNQERLFHLLLSMTVLLFCLGLFFLFFAYISEAIDNPGVNVFRNLSVQVIVFFIGLLAMYIVSHIKYHIYKQFIFFISIMSVVAMTLLFSPLSIVQNGATRWIDLGLFQFQPSEIMKIVLILFFAHIFTNSEIRKNMKKLFLATASGFGVLLIFTVTQPDYGTALIVTSAIMGIALIANLPKKWWFTVIGIAIFATVSLGFFAPDYLSNRFSTFYDINFGELTPEQKYGSAYHSLQNLEAVRVGGVWGQGLGYIAQSSHLNIPEVVTDSIFALIAAETGFVGSVVVIFLFLFFFLLCFTVAENTRDPFGKYLVVGITTLFAAQFLVNILVVLGLPATGIPLIFFSRGGTSLLLTLVAIGMILNVLRQQINSKRDVYRGSKI